MTLTQLYIKRAAYVEDTDTMARVDGKDNTYVVHGKKNKESSGKKFRKEYNKNMDFAQIRSPALYLLDR